MDCPICKKKDIGANIQKCPQCDTDLSSLSLIKNLREDVNKVHYITNLKIIIPLLIILSFIIYFFYQRNYVAIEGLKKEKKILFDSLYSLNDRLILKDSLKLKSEKRFITYTVKDYDNLWKLAKIFYDNGQWYYKIMEANQMGNSHILPGQKLKIYLE